ncbi:hypothetical protein BDK51DRAFT_45092, partial [Blyttiomyces helicus]
MDKHHYYSQPSRSYTRTHSPPALHNHHASSPNPIPRPSNRGGPELYVGGPSLCGSYSSVTSEPVMPFQMEEMHGGYSSQSQDAEFDNGGAEISAAGMRAGDAGTEQRRRTSFHNSVQYGTSHQPYAQGIPPRSPAVSIPTMPNLSRPSRPSPSLAHLVGPYRSHPSPYSSPVTSPAASPVSSPNNSPCGSPVSTLHTSFPYDRTGSNPQGSHVFGSVDPSGVAFRLAASLETMTVESHGAATDAVSRDPRRRNLSPLPSDYRDRTRPSSPRTSLAHHQSSLSPENVEPSSYQDTHYRNYAYEDSYENANYGTAKSTYGNENSYRDSAYPAGPSYADGNPIPQSYESASGWAESDPPSCPSSPGTGGWTNSEPAAPISHFEREQHPRSSGPEMPFMADQLPPLAPSREGGYFPRLPPLADRDDDHPIPQRHHQALPSLHEGFRNYGPTPPGSPPPSALSLGSPRGDYRERSMSGSDFNSHYASTGSSGEPSPRQHTDASGFGAQFGSFARGRSHSPPRGPRAGGPPRDDHYMSPPVSPAPVEPDSPHLHSHFPQHSHPHHMHHPLSHSQHYPHPHQMHPSSIAPRESPNPEKQTSSHASQRLPSDHSTGSVPHHAPAPITAATIAAAAAATPAAARRKKRVTTESEANCIRCGTTIGIVVLHGEAATLAVPHAVDVVCLRCEVGAQAAAHVAAAAPVRSRRKRVQAWGPGAEFDCDVCMRRIGSGGVRMVKDEWGGNAASACKAKNNEAMESPEMGRDEWIEPGFGVEVICSKCGGGGTFRTGKWRPSDIFTPGRKTCTLAHLRVGPTTPLDIRTWHLPYEAEYDHESEDLGTVTLRGRDALVALLPEIREAYEDGFITNLALPSVMEAFSILSTWELLRSRLARAWDEARAIFFDEQPGIRTLICLAWMPTARSTRAAARGPPKKQPPTSTPSASAAGRHMVAFIAVRWHLADGTLLFVNSADRGTDPTPSGTSAELVRRIIARVRADVEREHLPPVRHVWAHMRRGTP